MWLLLLLILSGTCKTWSFRCQSLVHGRDIETEERVKEILHFPPKNVHKENTHTKYQVPLNKNGTTQLKSFNPMIYMNATNEQKIFHDLFPIKRSKTHGFSISTSTKPFLASDPFHAGHTFSVVLPSESSATSKNRLYKQSAHNHSAQIAVEKNKWTRHTRSAGQDLVETRKTSSTESTQLERSQYSSKKKPALPDCKDKQDLDNCLEKALLNLSVAGLPHTKEQLLHVCGAFKRGMSCVDAFTSRCFSEERRNEFEENLASVRGFLAFLCDDPVFQRDYLSHGSCISKVGVHWQGCNDRFKYLVGKELRRSPSDLVGDTRRWRSICCLRHKFLTCVYHVGLSYCTQEDAIFLRKVSSALSHNSAKQLNCDSTTACSGASRNEAPLQVVFRWIWASLQFFL